MAAPIEAKSAAMQRLLQAMRRVAGDGGALLFICEPGSGEERLASHLHDLSRRDGAFVSVNCDAPAPDVARELMGWEQDGREQMGRLARASGGTLYLHRLDRLDAALHEPLLRALQEGEVRTRVGARLRVDVRLVASAGSADAVFRPLRALFRHELAVPPLRERGEDLLGLWQAAGGKALSMEEEAALLAYPWPGNLSELQAAARAGVLPAAAALPPGTSSLYERAMQAFERQLLEAALRRTGNNKKRAAGLLGMSRSNLYKRLERLGLLGH